MLSNLKRKVPRQTYLMSINYNRQIKWSSRMRGYAFLPTPDCDPKIKEFVKELMRKRREDK